MENKLSQLLRRVAFSATLLFLLVAVPANATLYQFYQEKGRQLPSVAERSQLASTLGMREYTGTVSQNLLLEQYLRANTEEDQTIGFGVASDYETTLAQSMTSNQTYLVVSSLLTRDGQTVSLENLNASKVYLTLEPGGSKEEFLMCTGVSTTIKRFESCTRGLSGIGTSTASVSANMRAHIAGSKVTMSNVHYVYNEYVDRDTAQTVGGLKTFTTIPRIPTSTPTDPSEVVSFGVLASTSYSGTVNASTIVKGIVELPTESEYSSGSVTGTTGALLVSTPAWNLTYSDHHFGNDLQYGQSLSYGDVLLVNSSTNQWNKALATDSTVLNKIIAVAFDTAATNTASRVLYPGSVVYSGSGFTIGSPVYLSDTGVASVSPGSNRVSIGVALSGSAWLFNPDSNFISSAVTSTANFIPVATASGTLQRGWIPFKFGGDGSDGPLSISSGTTTLNLGAAAFVVKNYTTIGITGTGVFNFSNPHANGTIIVLKSQGDCNLTSSGVPFLDASGMGAVAGTAVSATSGGTNGNSGTNGLSGLLNTGGSAGGVVAAATSLTGGQVSSYVGRTSAATLKYYQAFVGAGGGSGAASDQAASTATSGAGGRGGTTLILECNGAWNFTTTNGISVAGKAGSNGSYAGTRGFAQGGAGGAGGFFLGLYESLTANTGSVNSAAGSAGTGVLVIGAGTSDNTGPSGAASGVSGGSTATSAGVNAVGAPAASAAGTSLITKNSEF